MSDDKIKYTLSKPIQYGEREITEIEFRKPTVDDLVAVKKLPFTMIVNDSGSTEIEFNYNTLLKYLSRLAGEPESLFKKLSCFEFQNVGYSLLPFFNE